MASPASKKFQKIDENCFSVLPEDIFDNIFARLPIKSLGKFKCVSKSCRSLLLNPIIARAHLNFHIDNEPEGSILSGDTDLYRINLASKRNIFLEKLTFPSFDGILYSDVVGSCHGLVLARQMFRDGGVKIRWIMNLFNPITLETLEIEDSGSIITGLGYDSLRDDYKIVSISEKMPKNLSIYSVKLKTWRNIGNSPYEFISFNRGLFVNGCIHWTASKWNESGDALVAFSVAEEKFTELPLPEETGLRRLWDRTMLTVLGGCLALKHYQDDTIDYWVMKEYGVRDSWTKIIVPRPKNNPLLKGVGVLGEDEMFFIKERHELVAYNWKTGDWRTICDGIFHTKDQHFREMNFRESLISPNYK